MLLETVEAASSEVAIANLQHIGDSSTLPANIGSLTVNCMPVLTPTPDDPLFTFESRDISNDWVEFWSIKREDIDGVNKKKLQRQHVLHELITSEELFLRQLETIRYVYRYRIVLEPAGLFRNYSVNFRLREE